MPKPNRLIADATVLFSALVFNGLERQILRQSGIQWFSTDFNRNEIIRVLQIKAGLTAEEAESSVADLIVRFLQLNEYERQLAAADDLIGHRDKKDVPCLALALSIPNDGIWTSDRHFDHLNEIPVFTSRRLLEKWMQEKD